MGKRSKKNNKKNNKKKNLPLEKLRDDKITKIVCSKYIPNYIPVDNITPLIDQKINDIIEKKNIIIRLKNIDGDNGTLFENERKKLADEIIGIFIKIIELQNDQKNIDFSKLCDDEKFAINIRTAKLVMVVNNLGDIIPGFGASPECIAEFNKMGFSL